jgi:hypothetical protein
VRAHVGAAPAHEPHRAETARLPLLDDTLDLEVIADLLPDDHEPVSATVIGVHTGARAVIAYELERPNGGRMVVYGKHYAQRARAARLHSTLVALRAEADACGYEFIVPHSLGWSRELDLVLYAPAEGSFFDASTLSGEGPEAARRTGRCLAQLHLCRPPLDRTLDLQREAANLLVWARVVDQEGLSDDVRAGELAAHFARESRHLRLELGAPIHKDLHHRHVIVAPSVAFVDLDEMRWGDAIFDLAHFCTYLELLGTRLGSPRPTVASLQDAFLDGYAEITSFARDERFYLFGLYTCVKIAKQLCMGKGVPPIPRGSERRRQAHAVLRLGRQLREASAG